MEWSTFHQPKSFEGCLAHKALTTRLSHLAHHPSLIPHLLIYGPPSSGKSTKARCFLTAVFGHDVMASRELHEEEVDTGSRKQEVSIWKTRHHVELNPLRLGSIDRYVVQQTIKRLSNLSATNILKEVIHPLKFVVIENADALSLPAQQALRNTMEVYGKTCKIIFLSSNPSRIIPALHSRCVSIRISSPSGETTRAILTRICKREGVEANVDKILKESKGHLKKAILLLQLFSSYGSKIFSNPICGRTAAIVRNDILDVCVSNPKSQVVYSLRTDLLDLLCQTAMDGGLFLLSVFLEEGLREIKPHGQKAVIKWLNSCKSTDRALRRDASPLFAFELLLHHFISVFTE